MFSRPLAFIRDWVCAEHNLPPLAALVERKGTPAAANRFDPVRCADMSAADYAALEKQVLQTVYDYPNWDRALSGLQEMFTVESR